MPHAKPPDREPAPSATARETRIEQLLLAGLDRYFAGEHEHAIQVWSRVFFLDRGHARARAYIERARGALAERQREAEARVYRADASRSGGFEASGSSLGFHLEGIRDTGTAVRRDFPGAGPAPAVALAALEDEDEVGLADERALVPAHGRAAPTTPRPRVRIVAQTMLIVLAAALLFTAGYVVAARDHLASWWPLSSAAEPSAPGTGAGAPAAPGAAGSMRPHGSASR